MIFKPSAASEAFIEAVHVRVGARTKAVLGRSALLLAIGEGVPGQFKPADAHGKDLSDETVLGEELRDVVRAALNYRAGRALDEFEYRQEFRRHFEYGCKRTQEIWEESGHDPSRFVASLLKRTSSGAESCDADGDRSQTIPVVTSPVGLQIIQGAEEWIINEAGHNGLLVISGKPGSGKSQLALDLLAQISRQGLRFIFFDLKGELEEDPSNPDQTRIRGVFFENTGASHVRLIRQSLPINPLLHDRNATVNAQGAYEVASLIRAFAPQLGVKQERAIADAYQRLDHPDFLSLAQQLEISGATGVDLALIRKIVDLSLFATSRECIGPEEWLKSSLVIDFKEFGNDNDTKALAVALVLNLLMKRLNNNLPISAGVQPLKMVLFVDEAHLLLPKEGKAGLLSSLARQGRSWGFPLWLASQDADAFLTTGTNAANFAELASCGVHFSPETLKDAQQKDILGGISPHLSRGEALIRLHGKLSHGIARQYWRDRGQ